MQVAAPWGNAADGAAHIDEWWVPTSCMRDIFTPEPKRIAPVHSAPGFVKGSISVRGRKATVVDVRARFQLPVRGDAKLGMGVTIEHRGELFTLLVDRVCDIVCVPVHAPEKISNQNMSSPDAHWREMTTGVYTNIDQKDLAVLDVGRLLEPS